MQRFARFPWHPMWLNGCCRCCTLGPACKVLRAWLQHCQCPAGLHQRLRHRCGATTRLPLGSCLPLPVPSSAYLGIVAQCNASLALVDKGLAPSCAASRSGPAQGVLSSHSAGCRQAAAVPAAPGPLQDHCGHPASPAAQRTAAEQQQQLLPAAVRPLVSARRPALGSA